MNVEAVRHAMIDALQALDVNLNEYASPDPIGPGIQILPPAVDYAQSYGSTGLEMWSFTLQAFVPFTDAASTQIVLDELCATTGASSVRRLLEADTTLGGTVETLQVVRQSAGQQFIPLGGNPMLVVEFTVNVWARGG